MNTFERELKKIFDGCGSLTNPTFVGSACYGEVGPDLKAKIQFVSMGVHNQFDALRITVINRTEGQVDTVTLRFSDLLGKKRVSNPYFQEGLYPYIWKNQNDVQWYVYRPTTADYAIIREAAASYLDVFRQPLPEIPKAPPKQKKTTKAREQTR